MNRKFVISFIILVAITLTVFVSINRGIFFKSPEAKVEAVDDISAPENTTISIGKLNNSLSYQVSLEPGALDKSGKIYVVAYLSMDGANILPPGGMRAITSDYSEGKLELWLSKSYVGQVTQTNYIIVRVERVLAPDGEEDSTEILDEKVIPWTLMHE